MRLLILSRNLSRDEGIFHGRFWKRDPKCGTAGIETILQSLTESALTDLPGTDVLIPGDETAAGCVHTNLEMVALGKDLHSEKVGSLSAGVEIKGPFGGIGDRLLGRKEALKDPFPILGGDANTVILHHQLGP
jgi:hypothetical protein